MAYVDLADFKAYVGIADTVEDSVLTAALLSAEAAVTQYTGRDFTPGSTSASARVFRASGKTAVIPVDDFNSTSDLVVKIDDGDTGTYGTTLTIGTDFVLEPFNQRLHGLSWSYDQIRRIDDVWPGYSERARVQVTARWGWPAVPEAVTRAVLLTATDLFKRKDAPFGVAGFGEFGPVRAGSAAVPTTARDLLEPFKRYGIA